MDALPSVDPPAAGAPPTTNIALLADYENTAGHMHRCAREMLQHFRERGRVLIRKAYADWTIVPEKNQRSLAAIGYELVALTTYRRNGKNAADIRLVVDAMTIASTCPWIHSFVLVTGDSDYIPLIVRLREMGKRVILISGSTNVGIAALPSFCDELIPFSRWAEPDTPQPETIDAFTPIRECIESLFGGAPTFASTLKPGMVQLDPAFDEALYGYRRFSEYLRAAEQAGVISLSAVDTALRVTLRPPAGQPLSSSST